jgi:hypothetical protein
MSRSTTNSKPNREVHAHRHEDDELEGTYTPRPLRKRMRRNQPHLLLTVDGVNNTANIEKTKEEIYSCGRLHRRAQPELARDTDANKSSGMVDLTWLD